MCQGLNKYTRAYKNIIPPLFVLEKVFDLILLVQASRCKGLESEKIGHTDNKEDPPPCVRGNPSGQPAISSTSSLDGESDCSRNSRANLPAFFKPRSKTGRRSGQVGNGSKPGKKCRQGKKRPKTILNTILHPQQNFLSVVNSEMLPFIPTVQL